MPAVSIIRPMRVMKKCWLNIKNRLTSSLPFLLNPSSHSHLWLTTVSFLFVDFYNYSFMKQKSCKLEKFYDCSNCCCFPQGELYIVSNHVFMQLHLLCLYLVTWSNIQYYVFTKKLFRNVTTFSNHYWTVCALWFYEIELVNFIYSIKYI